MVVKIIIILDILLQGNIKIPLSSLQYQFQYHSPNFKFRIVRDTIEQCASMRLTKNRSIIHSKIMKENQLRGHSIPYSYLADKSSPFLHEFTRKSNAHNGTAGKFREDRAHETGGGLERCKSDVIR